MRISSAILLPCDLATARSLFRQLGERFPRSEEAFEGWELRATAIGSALLDREPGGEGGVDMELAKAASESLGRVVLLWPKLDEAVLEYVSGEEVEPSRDFRRWVEAHQIEELMPRSLPSTQQGWVVFVGLEPNEVRTALGTLRDDAVLEPGPVGAILWNRNGCAAIAAALMSERVSCEVLAIYDPPTSDRFRVRFIRDGEILGQYGEPAIADVEARTDVLGERDPRTIFERLGISL